MFSFFAPTLLRILVAVAFGFIAYVHYKRREELKVSLGVWLWIALAIEVLIALSLFLGYYTQIGALAGIIMSGTQAWYAKSHPRATPLCRVDYIFLKVICLSLLISGAGALAFDIPL
ncbi:hypothetical protein KW798_03985 [Candidatus Parcubacteria bacterium]|nr:hypothetical protein [Candidatus Parcubacteria bacterium]